MEVQNKDAGCPEISYSGYFIISILIYPSSPLAHIQVVLVPTVSIHQVTSYAWQKHLSGYTVAAFSQF